MSCRLKVWLSTISRFNHLFSLAPFNFFNLYAGSAIPILNPFGNLDIQPPFAHMLLLSCIFKVVLYLVLGVTLPNPIFYINNTTTDRISTSLNRSSTNYYIDTKLDIITFLTHIDPT